MTVPASSAAKVVFTVSMLTLTLMIIVLIFHMETAMVFIAG